MRVTRVFVEQPLQLNSTVPLDRETCRHLLGVLRQRHGNCCHLFNGDGYDYICTLEPQGKVANATVRDIVDKRPMESPLQIDLTQAISRGERMDFTLQKSVELGVSRIQPVFSQHSTVRLDAARLSRKQSHWLGIIHSACGQCGRSVVPELSTACRLSDWLASLPATEEHEQRIVLAPGADTASMAWTPLPRRVALLVGPEGGLDDDELTAAQQAGFQRVRLGPRVLRTETAALVAMSVLQARFGDLSCFVD